VSRERQSCAKGVRTPRAVGEVPVGDIEAATGAPASAITVTGTVLSHTTGEVVGAVVNAYWRTPGGFTLARSGISDKSWQYRLRIAAALGDGARRDFVVRVVDAGGETIGESSARHAPRERATVHARIPPVGLAALPEAGRLAEELRGRSPADLKAREILQLAAEIGETGERVRAFATAVRLSGMLGAPVVLLYALQRQGRPASLEHLSSVPESAIRKALGSAVQQGSLASQQTPTSRRCSMVSARSGLTGHLSSTLLGLSANAVPRSLGTVLRKNKIESLADLRDAGGLGRLVKTPDDATAEAVERLGAHARLSVLS
jgi:hypothetical protein